MKGLIRPLLMGPLTAPLLFLLSVMFAHSAFSSAASARWPGSVPASGTPESSSYKTCYTAGEATAGNTAASTTWQNEHGNTCPNEDSDGDTMINSWEDQYGLQWDGAGAEDDAYEDTDGDGATNAREYAQGSKPASSTETPTGFTDCDGDGYLDGDDPTPCVADATAEGGKWSLDSSYSGSATELESEDTSR